MNLNECLNCLNRFQDINIKNIVHELPDKFSLRGPKNSLPSTKRSGILPTGQNNFIQNLFF